MNEKNKIQTGWKEKTINKPEVEVGEKKSDIK